MDYRRYFTNYTRDVAAGFREQDLEFEYQGHRLLNRYSGNLEEQKDILTPLERVSEKRIEIGERRNRKLEELTQLLHGYDADLRVELRRLLGLWPEQPPLGPIRRFTRQVFRWAWMLVWIYPLAMMNIIFVGALAAALHPFVPACVGLEPNSPWVSVMLAVLFVWRRRGVLITLVIFGVSMELLVLVGMGMQVGRWLGG